mgnify:CR=1 FL=1
MATFQEWSESYTPTPTGVELTDVTDEWYDEEGNPILEQDYLGPDAALGSHTGLDPEEPAAGLDEEVIEVGSDEDQGAASELPAVGHMDEETKEGED